MCEDKEMFIIDLMVSSPRSVLLDPVMSSLVKVLSCFTQDASAASGQMMTADAGGSERPHVD